MIFRYLQLTEDGNRREFSWRTMSRHQSGAITYSGDQTSGYLGGSEYFDINLRNSRHSILNIDI